MKTGRLLQPKKPCQKQTMGWGWGGVIREHKRRRKKTLRKEKYLRQSH